MRESIAANMIDIHSRRSGWTSGGTHGERRRWVRAEWGEVWGGVSPLQPTKGFEGAS